MRMNVMKTAVCAACLLLPAAAYAQIASPIPLGPPTDLTVDVTTGPEGEPVVSATEFALNTGKYYRFNFNCPDAADDAAGFRLEVNDLLANSHLRVLSVGDIEVHLQGMSFRAIECDEAGSARFSFVPVRAGTYDLYIGNHSGKSVTGHFTVE